MQEAALVLIVDDQSRGRIALASLLEPEGYRLLFAESGPEALTLAAETPPDLVLLDVMMPEMDGYEVCRRLRADHDLALVPIVMVTALDDQAALLRGLEAGADDFVTKPFSRAELRARVRTITRLNRFRTMLAERQHASEELSAAYDATLAGWSRALDLRDHETEGHSRRVTELTVQLAQALGVTGPELEHIRRGALLHDIGKMGIPDAILLKPGPLDESEWATMRQHPTIAYELLAPIAYLWPALDIPYCHHERWDSTGYPLGLAGEKIPLAARIFAVVDVWDALTNDRPYRRAWSPERARDHIANLANSHFDPQVVQAFLAILDQRDHEAQAEVGRPTSFQYQPLPGG